jgi:transposase, IS30 family
MNSQKSLQKFKQLSISERDEIAILFNKKKYSLRDIALALTRNVSTISREIKNNSVKNKKTGVLEYVAKKATLKKHQRRKYCKITLKKIIEHHDLRKYIHEKIGEKDWSPETVSEMWNKTQRETYKEKDCVLISPKTIYDYCYSAYGQTLCPHLYQKRYHPKKRKKAHYDENGVLISSKKVLIPERVWIEERSQEIQERSRIGDTESDFIVSVQ